MNPNLSTDLNSLSIPYFLWDEPMTVAELKRRLTSASRSEQTRLLAKILREARDTDVWKFTTPPEVWRRWNEIAPQLGRRREFWKFLCSFWEKEGLLGDFNKSTNCERKKMIIRLAERNLKTKFGDFREILYYDGQTESIALVMGETEAQEDVLCRIHSSCITAHVFNSIECDCREQMEMSQAIIQQKGQGVIVWLDQEGKGNGHLALMASIPHKKAGLKQSEAYQKVGFEADARSFRPAAEILSDLEVKSVVLLTNNPAKADDLRRMSIIVSDTKEITISTDVNI